MTTDNQTIISTQAEQETEQPSFKRWLKHTFYLKRTKYLFSKAQQSQIADAITHAEDGHRGEIQVIIEASLPSDCAYHHTTLKRAQYLFGKYGVWDTEQNSGLLIYLNLCEHKVEIVADRGIHRAVDADCWLNICNKMIPAFQQGNFTEGLCVGVQALGEILQDFYQDDLTDKDGNELPNLPRLL